MRRTLVIVVVASTIGLAQQPNATFSSLGIDAGALGVIGQSALEVTTLTDSPHVLEALGSPGTPLIVAYGAPTHLGPFVGGAQIELMPFTGTYANTIVLDGTANPAVTTDAVTGLYTTTMPAPSCITHPSTGVTTCMGVPVADINVQAVTTTPLNQPFGYRLTAATTLHVTNGYQGYPLPVAGSGTFDFLDGMNFDFYGNTYTRLWVNSDGRITFTPAAIGVAPPTVASVRTGAPAIMPFHTRLDPTAFPLTRIYAQQWVDAGGDTHVRISFDRVAELGNLTGPHGGTVELIDTGEIIVSVAAYNAAPSINTAIGITPGGGIDGGVPPAPGQTAFGRNLSTDLATAPIALPPFRAAFELFDHSTIPSSNPMDLAGQTIHFVPDGSGTAYTLF